MRKRCYALLGVLFLVSAVAAGNASCYVLNPYLPYNAVAAQPPTPYYLRDIPKVSRTYYDPCPTCGPVAKQFPDVPPIQLPFPGMLGMPVPVP